MRHTATLSLAALLASTTIAAAGGLDRSQNGYGILFEDGNRFELGLSSAMPEVTGSHPAGIGGGTTGDMAGDDFAVSTAFKLEVNDRMGVAFFMNMPYQADASYAQGFYTGLDAQWESTGSSIVLSYDVSDRVTVYGGLRQVKSQATIAIPDQLNRAGLALAGAAGNAAAAALAASAPAGSLAYSAATESDTQTGWIAGAAYQRPEIALRVALTYEQGFTHSFGTTETLPAVAIVGAQSVTDIEMPDTWTLDFQTGVAPGTLVFGSIRYADWSVWEVRPAGFESVFGTEVTDFDNPVTTYRIGIGRQVTDNLSMFARATYEASNGGIASRLYPTDGTTGLGLGGTYTMGNSEITAGVEYQWLGDAETSDGTEFAGNTAMGFGITFAQTF